MFQRSNILSFVFFTIAFTLLISCKHESNSVEIYLVKNRIDTKEGVPLSEIKEFKQKNSPFSKAFINGTKYDTVKRDFILAGSFDAKYNQLKKEPFILDSEIELLDTIKSEIHLTPSGFKKIKELKPDMIHGIQFVICSNKIPVFTGYFWSINSSHMSTWNCIEYNYLDEKQNNPLKLFKGEGTHLPNKSKIHFKDYKYLVEAFKNNNKLKE
jgi:hypothetical protein